MAITEDKSNELRTIYEELAENKDTIFLMIDSSDKDLVMPPHLKNTGNITFDISPSAVRELEFSAKYVEFKTTFNNKTNVVSIPYDAIIALIRKD